MQNSTTLSLQALEIEFPTEYAEMEANIQYPTAEGIARTSVQTRLDPRVREYKLPNGNRVLFFLNFETLEVYVGYAGRHLNKRRMDQQILKIRKEI